MTGTTTLNRLFIYDIFLMYTLQCSHYIDGVIVLRVQEAVKLRILELAQTQQITINHLAEVSGVAPSALKYIVAPYARVKNTGVVTIKKLCQGLGIPFSEFWKSPLFDNLEDEEEI